MNGKDTALFSKASDEWSTPQWLFGMLDLEFYFLCDAAATAKNRKTLSVWFGTGSEQRWLDALKVKDWQESTGVRSFFLNPPYSKIAAFMKKAYEESQKGATVVCLIPSRTDTRYWHDYVMKAQEIRFVKGRLKFGDQKNSAPFPSCVVIFWQKEPESINDPPIIGKTIEQPRKVTA